MLSFNKTFRLFILFALTVMVSSCFNSKGNKIKSIDPKALDDSIKAAENEFALADPRSQQSLEKSINEWTQNRDQIQYYSADFQSIKDSIDHMSQKERDKDFFTKDIWYDRSFDNYDDNGRDSLLKVIQYTDTVSEVLIQCVQFNKPVNKTVKMRYNTQRERWEIDDFKIEKHKSIREQCEEGIAKFNKILEDRRAAEEAQAEADAESELPE